ncbi:MAG: amidohydrolase family protein [Planctomycetes bacterium]|nr:amidohydrolase family protein [Planctomycetota bacterium]
MPSIAASLAFVGGRWVEGVEVAHEGGVIRAVRRVPGAGRGRILLPGLVNAHAHLELTFLGGKLPPAPFPEWAQGLMEARAGWTPADVEASLREGIRRSVASGTAAVGDFAWLSKNDALRQSGLRAVSWREALGIAPERAEESAARAGTFLEKKTSTWTPGLAPHAPYSCSGELYRKLHSMARRARVPFATHLSELREEIEYLRTGRGAFAAMLQKIGRDAGSWRPPRRRPVAYLAGLGVLRRTTAAHANYLTPADVALLKRDKAVVVWCPRTHDFFGHPAHPTRRLLRAGVPVALGTDSLGSSPDLSVREEMRMAMGKGFTLEETLKMATESGAKALGLRRAGRIAPGWAADFTVIGGSAPLEILPGPVLDVIVAGKRLRLA